MALLVEDMVQTDPAKRPTMDEVLKRFNEICSQLGSWKLRSRLVYNDRTGIIGFYHTTVHWVHRIGYVLGRVPAIPIYRDNTSPSS